jgi:MoaA/NifB/PqqE/SkfB family radical SAM enzyme
MENVYSQVKMFHFGEKLHDLKNGRVSPPIHIRLKPINACNHRCFYCCYRNPNLLLNQRFNEKDMIAHAKMREITEDLAIGGVKAVTFTGGGEPLIYPYICEAVQALINNDIKVAVLTNGARLKGEVAGILADGASWVRISIDAADRETYAESRGVGAEEFDYILSNIKNFARQKHPDCELGINFIVTQFNVEKVFTFIKLMKDHGADHVKVSECVVSIDGRRNNQYHADYFDVVKAQIKRAQQELGGDGFQVVDKFHNFEEQYQKLYSRCPFINFINVVAADLNVYSCQDKAYTDSGILGSIENRSLRDLWNSDAYATRLAALKPSRLCGHHCVQHWKNLMLLDFLDTDERHLEFV